VFEGSRRCCKFASRGNKFHRRNTVISQNSSKEDGRSVFSEENPRISVNRQILEVQGRYSSVFSGRFKLRRGRALIRVSQDRWIYTYIVYRGFVDRTSKVLQTGIAISRSAISRQIRTVHHWGQCQKVQGSRGSEYREFRGQSILAAWNRETRYPDGES
jgi:hypothetical protein